MSRKPSVQAETGRKRRAATKADIAAATKRLLAAGTPAADLSIERIVSEAGVSRATFYRAEGWSDRVAAHQATGSESSPPKFVFEIRAAWLCGHVTMSCRVPGHTVRQARRLGA